jgi:hypothetical protein
VSRSRPGHVDATLGRSGQAALSLATSVENLEQAEATLGRDHPRLGYVLTAIAAAHNRLGQSKMCIDYARRAVALREKGLPSGSWLTALSKTWLADCLGSLGENAEAIAL